MKIAVLGSGGREHALCWKLAQSVGEQAVFCLPGNGGIPNSHALDISDFGAINKFCLAHEIELIVVGPEQALVDGIVDYFLDISSNIKVFGPDKAAAALEGSKLFAKTFMNKYEVQTASYNSYNKPDDAFREIERLKGSVVIKYDGLAGGKGVYVCSSITEANKALEELENKYGSSFPFLLEQKLQGEEISIIGITDGETMKLLPAAQDHKQLLEGDKGPNTGGMGAFTPVDFCDEKILSRIKDRIVDPTLYGIKQEGFTYKGFVFFGIMMDMNEPYLLEYNVRFGDPEAEVLLPGLEADLVDIILSCFNQDLGSCAVNSSTDYFVDVVKVSKGYPNKYPKGLKIAGQQKTLKKGEWIFHAGTKMNAGVLETIGGRVLNFVGQGKTLEEAISRSYELCKTLSFDGEFYRKDIGRRSNFKSN